MLLDLWPFGRRAKRVKNRTQWDLSEPVFWWSKRDALSLGAACQGIQIWGATGSGKSTGSLAALCRAFLKRGFGGIFLTVKPSDRQFYESLVAASGRLDDLMVFGPDEPWRYNFINAELQRRDAAAGATENLTGILSAVLEVTERNGGQSGQGDESFWKRMNRQLMKNSIELLVRSKGSVTMPELYRLVVSAPMSIEQVNSENWQQSSFCFQCLKEADARPKTSRQQNDYRLAADFFLLEWPNLSNRTRSVVQSTLSSMLDGLMRGVARELLSSEETNITPEMAQDGKLILIDLPLKIWGDAGQFVQIIWKYCFQKAQERRDIQANPRPVFLVVDESHLLCVSSDQVFQTTARSSRTVTIYATQSISNYLAALGGDRAEPEVHSLLGNLQTQIFHQQIDIKTNSYAAELIGRTRQFFVNMSESAPPPDWFGALTGFQNRLEINQTAGVTESYEFEIQPSEFSELKQGGPPDWEVEAIVVQGGKQFRSTGRPWLRTAFDQFV